MSDEIRCSFCQVANSKEHPVKPTQVSVSWAMTKKIDLCGKCAKELSEKIKDVILDIYIAKNPKRSILA